MLEIGGTSAVGARIEAPKAPRGYGHVLPRVAYLHLSL